MTMDALGRDMFHTRMSMPEFSRSWSSSSNAHRNEPGGHDGKGKWCRDDYCEEDISASTL